MRSFLGLIPLLSVSLKESTPFVPLLTLGGETEICEDGMAATSRGLSRLRKGNGADHCSELET